MACCSIELLPQPPALISFKYIGTCITEHSFNICVWYEENDAKNMKTLGYLPVSPLPCTVHHCRLVITYFFVIIINYFVSTSHTHTHTPKSPSHCRIPCVCSVDSLSQVIICRLLKHSDAWQSADIRKRVFYVQKQKHLKSDTSVCVCVCGFFHLVDICC